MNRQLLTIDSAEKQNAINELLKGFNYGSHLWLGAIDEFYPAGIPDRPFYWSATLKEFEYANWRDDKPQKINGTQHCVLIEPANNKWLSWRCTAEIGFICEEKQSLVSSNKNSNNASVDMEKFIKDFELKFLNLLKDNMAQLNEQLETIRQVSLYTNQEVDILTNITQTGVEKILNKQELSTKELNHEITKQGNDLNDQLKRSVDELNEKFCEKQNVTYTPIVLINQTG